MQIQAKGNRFPLSACFPLVEESGILWIKTTGDMSHYMDYITIDPAVMMGKPVITGTRITVEQILEEMSAGKLPQDLLTAHSTLSEGAIRAALAFSADALRGERSYPIAS